MYMIDGSHVGNTDRQSTSDILSIGNYQSGGQRFAKYLDFRIYNAALTDANIVDVYGNGEVIWSCCEITSAI